MVCQQHIHTISLICCVSANGFKYVCKHITNPFALATYQGYCSQLIKNIVCKYKPEHVANALSPLNLSINLCVNPPTPSAQFPTYLELTCAYPFSTLFPPLSVQGAIAQWVAR